MENQIVKFIESFVRVVNGSNVFTLHKDYHTFAINEGNDSLPVQNTHWVEGNLNSGDDELYITYTLVKYEVPFATYMITLNNQNGVK